jgi:hypothetical protein
MKFSAVAVTAAKHSSVNWVIFVVPQCDSATGTDERFVACPWSALSLPI